MIKILNEHAHEYGNGTFELTTYPELEKFAELLIKRCGQVLVDNTPVVNLVEDWDKGYDRAMNDCIHHIYGHFGLEE